MDTIDLIPLPLLKTIDRPFRKDEPHLEKALSQSIMKMLTRVRRSPDFDDPQADQIAANHTWPRVFDRTLSVYMDALMEIPELGPLD